MIDDFRVGGTPSIGGTRIAPAGKAWDAVRLPRQLGLQALSDVAGKVGAIVMEPAVWRMYFLVPPGSTRAWSLPQTTALGETNHVVLPPVSRERPPGPYWLISPRHGRLHTSTDDLYTAVEIALGLRPGKSATNRPDLEHLTSDQIKGRNCALCNAGLHTDRSLGIFCTAEGLLSQPTELRACAPRCRPQDYPRELE